jgi:hypothetical protein
VSADANREPEAVAEAAQPSAYSSASDGKVNDRAFEAAILNRFRVLRLQRGA